MSRFSRRLHYGRRGMILSDFWSRKAPPKTCSMMLQEVRIIIPRHDKVKPHEDLLRDECLLFQVSNQRRVSKKEALSSNQIHNGLALSLFPFGTVLLLSSLRLRGRVTFKGLRVLKPWYVLFIHFCKYLFPPSTQLSSLLCFRSKRVDVGIALDKLPASFLPYLKVLFSSALRPIDR